MYSIPAYALRFAAHCRSRLRISELSPADGTRVPTNAANFWIRMTRSHERATGAGCVSQRPSRSRS